MPEDFFEFQRRVSQNSFFLPLSYETPTAKSAPRAKSRKVKRKSKSTKLSEQIAALGEKQINHLKALAAKTAFSLLIDGDGYTVFLGDPYRVEHAGEGDDYEVAKDFSSCTCPDFKFRNHSCKHILALKEVLRGTPTASVPEGS